MKKPLSKRGSVPAKKVSAKKVKSRGPRYQVEMSDRRKYGGVKMFIAAYNDNDLYRFGKFLMTHNLPKKK